MDLLSEGGVLALGVAVEVHSVQVLPVQVVPEHALEHPLGVQHGQQREVEMLPQQVGPVVAFVQQEPQYTLHAVGGRRLPRVHSRRNYDPWLVDLEGPLSLLEDALHCRLSLTAYVPAVSDGDEMHPSCLAGAAEGFLVEVDLRVVAVLAGEAVHQVFAVLVGVGVGEGELHPVLLLEAEAEGELGLVRRVVLRGGGCTYIRTSVLTFSKGRWGLLRATGWYNSEVSSFWVGEEGLCG
jgi:hypothetical protein